MGPGSASLEYEKTLGCLGFMPPRSQHQWLLIDGRTRTIVDRGADDLLTVMAHYIPHTGGYQLDRSKTALRDPSTYIVAGNFKSTDDLMNAVTTEISKL